MANRSMAATIRGSRITAMFRMTGASAATRAALTDMPPSSQVDDLGFAQAQGGELDQGYAEDEAQEYEIEEAPRGRRPMMMAVVLAGAIAIGGGLTYTYKSILGGTAGGDPPIVKSAAAPSKVKPDDGGGKQFSHTDSKIMGRLGDGSGSAAADGSTAAAASEADANGTRKVSTLVVGRDGSIQAPAAAEANAEPTGGTVAVPGMTVVDGLGPTRAPAAAATMASVNAPPANSAEHAKRSRPPSPRERSSFRHQRRRHRKSR